MDERPELYELESVEQLRTIADPLRLSIARLISETPLTATQVGEALGVPANKAHYHLRELERVGVVRIVATREKGGILEKYYQTVARGISIPKDLLRQASPDESIAAATEVLQSVVHDFLAAFSHVVRTQDWDAGAINLDIIDLWVTPEELREMTNSIREILKPFQNRRAGDDVRAISFLRLTHPAVESAAEREANGSRTESEEPLAGPHPRNQNLGDIASQTGDVLIEGSTKPETSAAPRPTVVAGVVNFSRADLEKLLVDGQRLNLHVLGRLSFSSDVSAELVDRTIAHLQHRGALSASPDVKAVLKRKGVKTQS